MKKILFLLSIAAFFSVSAQVTLKVMHQNLTNYGNYTSYCTTTNNNVSIKAQNFKKVVKYVNPDILTVNELKPLTFYVNHLRDSVLNTDGVNYYSSVSISNNAGSDIANMLYYDNRKLAVAQRTYIAAPVRDIDFIKLYYKSPNLATTHDTAFIICIIAHLKAGNTSTDAAKRAEMTQAVQNYLNNINQPLNYLIMGDFNVYNSAEQAFQNLVSASNPNSRFYDPINRLGAWNNNANFASVHTQSTHYDDNGCLASGGMDDRFDFILISQSVRDGLDKVQYIPNSYKAIGQDGNHFNQSINSGTNTDVPADIANALYNTSDHLPVVLSLQLNVPAAIEDVALAENYGFNLQVYPTREHLEVVFNTPEPSDISLSLFSLDGREIMNNMLKNIQDYSKITIPAGYLPSGLYILKAMNDKGITTYKKFYKP